jgi:hypothetical protein
LRHGDQVTTGRPVIWKEAFQPIFPL